jgi:hypothetical protein
LYPPDDDVLVVVVVVTLVACVTLFPEALTT